MNLAKLLKQDTKLNSIVRSTTIGIDASSCRTKTFFALCSAGYDFTLDECEQMRSIVKGGKFNPKQLKAGANAQCDNGKRYNRKLLGYTSKFVYFVRANVHVSSDAFYLAYKANETHFECGRKASAFGFTKDELLKLRSDMERIGFWKPSSKDDEIKNAFDEMLIEYLDKADVKHLVEQVSQCWRLVCFKVFESVIGKSGTTKRRYEAAFGSVAMAMRLIRKRLCERLDGNSI